MYDSRFLIIAGIIVIGIAIGFEAMVDEEIQADRNRDVIKGELVGLAELAQLAYAPSGGNGYGGNGTFCDAAGDILLRLNKINLDSNYYSIEVFKSDYLLLCGVGHRKYEGKPVEVHMRVWPESTRVEIIN